MSTGAWIAVGLGVVILGFVGYAALGAHAATNVPQMQGGSVAAGNSDLHDVAGIIQSVSGAASSIAGAFGGNSPTGYGNGGSYQGQGALRPTGY